MITPAISVLSAVKGLQIVEPALKRLVIPMTVVIIVALFVAQRVSTARVGRLFGPVMILWFLTLGAAGVAGILAKPGIPRGVAGIPPADGNRSHRHRHGARIDRAEPPAQGTRTSLCRVDG